MGSILNASVFFASDHLKHSIWIQLNCHRENLFGNATQSTFCQTATATVGPWTAVSFTRWRPSTHFWIVIQLLAAYFPQTNSHIRIFLTRYRNQTAPMCMRHRLAKNQNWISPHWKTTVLASCWFSKLVLVCSPPTAKLPPPPPAANQTNKSSPISLN